MEWEEEWDNPHRILLDIYLSKFISKLLGMGGGMGYPPTAFSYGHSSVPPSLISGKVIISIAIVDCCTCLSNLIALYHFTFYFFIPSREIQN